MTSIRPAPTAGPYPEQRQRFPRPRISNIGSREFVEWPFARDDSNVLFAVFSQKHRVGAVRYGILDKADRDSPYGFIQAVRHGALAIWLLANDKGPLRMCVKRPCQIEMRDDLRVDSVQRRQFRDHR